MRIGSFGCVAVVGLLSFTSITSTAVAAPEFYQTDSREEFFVRASRAQAVLSTEGFEEEFAPAVALDYDGFSVRASGIVTPNLLLSTDELTLISEGRRAISYSQVEFTSSIVFTFARPIHVFGVDLNSALDFQRGGAVTMRNSNLDSDVVVRGLLPTGNRQFAGVIDLERSFTSVTIISSVQFDEIGIDRVRFGVAPPLPSFRRADANGDGTVDVSDALFLLNWLFSEGDGPACWDAADGNDDGAIDIGDAVKILNFLFGGRAPLPDPGVKCGTDPTRDPLDCGDSQGC